MKPLDSDKKVSKEVSAPAAAAQAAPEVPEKIDFSNVEIEPLFKDFVDFDTFAKSDYLRFHTFCRGGSGCSLCCSRSAVCAYQLERGHEPQLHQYSEEVFRDRYQERR